MNMIPKTVRSMVLGALLLSAAAAPAFALDGLDFRLHNDTNTELTGFFVNPLNSSEWIPVRGQTLAPGDVTTVNASGSFDSCYYNIAAHFSDGSISYERDVNLCRVADIYV